MLRTETPPGARQGASAFADPASRYRSLLPALGINAGLISHAQCICIDLAMQMPYH
jgi:hypothetical protein